VKPTHNPALALTIVIITTSFCEIGTGKIGRLPFLDLQAMGRWGYLRWNWASFSFQMVQTCLMVAHLRMFDFDDRQVDI